MNGKRTLFTRRSAGMLGFKGEGMPADRKKPWFAVKRFGYGVGLPIAWEGWLTLLAYGSAMILAGILLPKFAFVVLAILLSAAAVYIAYTRSDGEWRYRNGE